MIQWCVRRLVNASCDGRVLSNSLNPDSSELTKSITPMGRFCFRRISFGIALAPEMFQHNMTALLASLDEVEVTIDNFSLFRWGEHGARLDSKLNEIQQSGLKPKKDKCEFRKSEIEYFGHIISGDGVRPSEKRLTVIKKMSPPLNILELRGLIGLINYLWTILANLASIINPMADLLKFKRVWMWKSAKQTALDEIKEVTHLCWLFMTKQTLSLWVQTQADLTRLCFNKIVRRL